MFKWVCLAIAVMAAVLLGWMVNDLRLELEHSARTINENLPEILANTRKGSQTLAVLAEDLRQLRDLAGASGETRDHSLVVYADSLLDLVEASDGKVGLAKKVFGSGLKDVLPAKEWVVDARKEALWLSFNAKSRTELLDRLTRNKFGSDWYLQIGDQEPVALRDWLQVHHPETKALAEPQAEEP